MRHPSIGVVTRAATIALLAAGVAGVAGQTPPQKPPEPQPPPFRTEANFVRVDVYPTSAGRPVGDLRREEFELLEDGRLQSIDTFEFIRIAAGAGRAERADPNTVEAMRQAAAAPRSRVFVIFLDALHVTQDGARNVSRALGRFLERLLGPDDLVGIMTPWMSPADVVLARKTEVIERGLREASWGRRFTTDEDARETMYKGCYRVLQQELEQGKTVSDLARVLTVRRREAIALEALGDLVSYLRGVREERKAIITVTEGWMLFKPDPEITRLREECTCPSGRARRDLQDCGGCQPWPKGAPWKERVPGAEPIRVGPDGRLTLGSVDTESGIVSSTDCNADRMRLAEMDNERFLRNLASDANRANATFYTVDPRGLAVFDTPIYVDADEVGTPLGVVQDAQSMRRRHAAMSDLALGTDGIALMNSNALDAGLARIADDLSSYYLLGYYSTNPRLDGKYRSLTVRVKRPGVEVRARRGYRAPTEAEVAAARSAGAAPAPEPVSAVQSALAALARFRSDARFRVHAVPDRPTQPGRVSAVWVAGELPAGLQGWGQGATVSVELTGPGVSGGMQVTLGAGERAFLIAVPVQGSAAAIDVRARLTNPDPTVTPFSETVRLDLSTSGSQPLLFRRRPGSGNRLQPAADFQFSRTERVRLELALDAGMAPGPGRLLDKAGQELEVPVTVGERIDPATSRRWLTADLILAPLAAGDYVVEISAASGGAVQKTLTAIRVTR